MRLIRHAAVSLAVCCLATAAFADDSQSGGRYEIGAYVWGTSLALRSDTPDGSTSQHISFSDLLEHLTGGLQAHARGEWGNWSVDLDGMYAKLHGDDVNKVVRLGPQ